MPYELDVIALSAGAFTALGVGLKSVWDRFWNRRERREERDAQRDEVHRNELRLAYVSLISAFHKMIDDGFALAMVFLEHKAVHDRMQAVAQLTAVSVAMGNAPPPVVAEFQEVDQRAKRIKAEFFAGMTDVQGKAVSVMLLDDDTLRGLLVNRIASEKVPPLNTVSEVEAWRRHLQDQRERFDDLIADLGGAFAPRRWSDRLTQADPEQPEVAEDAAPNSVGKGTKRRITDGRK